MSVYKEYTKLLCGVVSAYIKVCDSGFGGVFQKISSDRYLIRLFPSSSSSSLSDSESDTDTYSTISKTRIRYLSDKIGGLI